jgi:transcriptional regulator with XRE-family HTH domain
MCAKLRELRVAAGMTQKVAGEALEWSTSKVLRVEAAASFLKISDLTAMLNLYGVTDVDLIEKLSEAVRNNQPPRNAHQKGKPSTIRKTRYTQVTTTHSELLYETNEYVGGVLNALTDLNAAVRGNDHEAAANAFDAVLRAAQRGRALKGRLHIE